MGQLTPMTTVFDELIQYFTYTMKTYQTLLKEFGTKRKLQNDNYENLEDKFSDMGLIFSV